MDNTTNAERIIANLKQEVDTLWEKLRQLQNTPLDMSNPNPVQAREATLRALSAKLNDACTALKLQEYILSDEAQRASREYIKACKKKMKNVGWLASATGEIFRRQSTPNFSALLLPKRLYSLIENKT